MSKPEKSRGQYRAKVGISFEGLKGKPRVEAGDLLPANVPQTTIDDLLANGDIEEVEA